MLRLEINTVLHSKKSKVNKACSLDDLSLKKLHYSLETQNSEENKRCFTDYNS